MTKSRDQANLASALRNPSARRGDGESAIRRERLIDGPSGANGAMLEAILSSLEESKAEDVSLIDIQGKSALGDYMVIASGTSRRRVASISERVLRDLKSAGFERPKCEGLENCDWVLIDAGDVIVHVFQPETREFYGIEKMWSVPDSREAG